jgi:hypothetical protein
MDTIFRNEWKSPHVRGWLKVSIWPNNLHNNAQSENKEKNINNNQYPLDLVLNTLFDNMKKCINNYLNHNPSLATCILENKCKTYCCP